MEPLPDPFRPDPRKPESFARRLLVAALGLAPQVVTETFWALVVQRGFVPTEIHLVTTVEGAASADALLLGESGSLAALAADLERPDIAAIPVSLHVIGGADPLADIDSDADNRQAADLFVAVMQRLAADPDAALHVSIAGGRKTMGFLAGYALSLFARPQDRLSHVLVQLPFQNLPDFHFPPRVARTFVLRDGRACSTADARLVLADIPFVRLRENLPPDVLGGGLSFSDMVARAQSSLDPPSIVVDLHRGRFVCHGIPVPLSPVNFAFAAWLATRLRDHGPDGGAVRWTDPVRGELAALHRRLSLADLRGDGRFIDESYFRQRVSRVTEAIRAALGELSGPYIPRSIGKRPNSRTGFGLLASCVLVS